MSAQDSSAARVAGVRGRLPRVAGAAVERARLSVVPRPRRRTPRVPFVVLVSLLLVGGVAGLLMLNTTMQQHSFAATALQTRATALQAREQELRMELAHLRDPQRLAEQARGMGLVPPASPAFLRLSDGRVLGRPTPAQADDGIRVTPLPAPKPRVLRPPPLRLTVRATRAAGTTGAATAGETSGSGTTGTRPMTGATATGRSAR